MRERLKSLGLGVLCAWLIVSGLIGLWAVAPVMADGWFPRLSPNGQHVASGAGSLTVDGVDVGVRGWAPEWVSNTAFIYNAAQDGLRLFEIGRTATRALDPREFSETAGATTATGLLWAGRDPSTNTLQISDGRAVLNAGQPSLAEDGFLIFRVADDKIEPTACVQAAAWGDGRGQIFGFRRSDPAHTPANVTIPGRKHFRPVCIDTPTGPWLLTMTHTELLLHEFGGERGYLKVTGNDGNLHSHAVFRDDEFRVVFNDARGGLHRWTVKASDPRINLRGVVLPPPPPPPPQRKPEVPNRKSVVADVIKAHPEINSCDENSLDTGRALLIDWAAQRLNQSDPPATPIKLRGRDWSIRWGRKSRGEPSKDGKADRPNTDALTFLRADGRFEICDAISGGKPCGATWDCGKVLEQGENGYWAPPQLGPESNTPPPPPPPDCKAVSELLAIVRQDLTACRDETDHLRRLKANLDAQLQSVTRALAEANAEIVRLKTQPPPEATCLVEGPGWVRSLFGISCRVIVP